MSDTAMSDAEFDIAGAISGWYDAQGGFDAAHASETPAGANDDLSEAQKDEGVPPGELDTQEPKQQQQEQEQEQEQEKAVGDEGPGDLRVALRQEREQVRQLREQMQQQQQILQQYQAQQYQAEQERQAKFARAEEQEFLSLYGDDPDMVREFYEQRHQAQMQAWQDAQAETRLRDLGQIAAQAYPDYVSVMTDAYGRLGDLGVDFDRLMQHGAKGQNPVTWGYEWAKANLMPSPEALNKMVEDRVKAILKNSNPQKPTSSRGMAGLPSAAPIPHPVGSAQEALANLDVDGDWVSQLRPYM